METIMKTYLSQNYWKKLVVFILLSLTLIGAVEAGQQNSCDTCCSQETFSIAQQTDSNNLDRPATCIKSDITQLSDRKLIEEYCGSIESRIVSIISNMMAIFIILALFSITG